ncbi:MASE1 domain-containing protein [Bosea eneae]|uniref:histidine kinase n=1 Tax=Bosea eneae TaxID=151454 RepID=A0ABW0IWA2_9HYPH
MYAWSPRPRLLHLGLFFSAYLLGCGFAQALAIVPGITVSIWPPGGLFMATLILASPYSWPWWILSGCLAEMTAQLLWFHSPPLAGLLIFIGNALCAAFGATLVNRALGRPVRLETLPDVFVFVVLGAGVAPLVSATIGSATLAWFGVKSQTFTAVWPLFWIGDATGILLVAPLALVAIQSWRSKTRLSAGQWMEAGILGLIFLGIAALSLKHDFLLSAYIIMPPILWAAVRFEFKGVAVALTFLALVTLALTISGASQFVGDAETQRQKQVMLQLFLAISALSALIVAAISRQHQQALLSLRQRERSMRELLETLPTCIWCAAPDGELTYFSPQFRDFVGFDIADKDTEGASRLSNVLKAIVHPDELEAVKAHFSRCLATGEPYARKHRLRRFDGQYRWVETRAAAMRNSEAKIVQWNGVFLDMDDQMRLHSEVQERDAKIRRLVESDVIGIVFWDLDGRLIDANDAFLRLVQYDRTDVEAGLRWFDMTPPEWQEVHNREEAEEIRATGKMQAREKEFFRKDGSRVPVLIGAACFEGQPTQGVAYILDLTERKRAEAEQTRAEEALRRSQLQLQQLVDTVPVQIWCVMPGGEPAYINKTMMDYIGLKLDDFDAEGGLPSAIQTLVHPDDRAALQAALFHSFSTGEAFAMRFRNRRADGEYRWQDGRAEPLYDECGRIIRWFGANVDIHDLVTAQDALRAREHELAQLVDMLPVYIRRLTPEGEPIFFNKRLTDFIGVSLEEIRATGTSRLAPAVENFVHPDETAKVMAALRRAVATGEHYTMKYRMRGANGVYRWIETRAEPLRNQDGTIAQWYSMSIDIEDQVRALRAEEALRQASDELAKATQAASLAELSASIAHEVNQPLAAIVANSHACNRWLAAEPPNLERAKITAERIIRNANSAADVVSRIRALFNQSTQSSSATALGSAIKEAVELIADEAAQRHVRIDTDIEADLPPVPLDRVQVQQVLINLIRNGMEAMESTSDDKVLGIRARRLGDVVQTEISDCGPGIASSDKMFEPFFTTKANGMGMGLTICRSIVESHGGRLWADKNEPCGAIFVFTLPVEPKAAP